MANLSPFLTAAIVIAIALCTSAWISTVRADDVADPHVVVLTEDDFDTFVDKEPLTLVEFYAPWCGHCKRLVPEYEKAAALLLKENPPIRLAKVDATEETGLGGRFGVRGYPTLRIFRNGESSEYKGPREADGIVSYMKKQVGGGYVDVKTLNSLQTLLDQGSDALVVGFFVDGSNSVGLKAFKKLASDLRDSFRFALVGADAEEALVDEYKLKNTLTVFLAPRTSHAKFEKPFESLHNPKSAKDMEEFVYEHSIPLVGPFGRDTEPRYQRRKQPVVLLFADVDFAMNPKQANYYANRLRKVAKEFVGRVTFAVANKAEFDGQLTEKYGLSESAAKDLKTPHIVIDDAPNANVFPMGEEVKFSPEEVSKFVKSFVNGELKPWVKSEPVPAKQEKGKATVVVGSTFQEIVNNADKDVLIEFYAPWCGHCKKLDPIYNEVAAAFKDDENIVIAKIDATANKVFAPYDVKGFPTIYFAPANDKKSPKKYEGGREKDDFIKYIKKNRTTRKLEL